MKENDKTIAKFVTFMKAFEINCSVDEITKDQINLYFTAFKPFSISEVEKAFSKVMYTWEYTKMPPIGIFIRAIDQGPLLEDAAQIQAAEVLRQVRMVGAYGAPEFKDQ